MGRGLANIKCDRIMNDETAKGNRKDAETNKLVIVQDSMKRQIANMRITASKATSAYVETENRSGTQKMKISVRDSNGGLTMHRGRGGIIMQPPRNNWITVDLEAAGNNDPQETTYY